MRPDPAPQQETSDWPPRGPGGPAQGPVAGDPFHRPGGGPDDAPPRRPDKPLPAKALKRGRPGLITLVAFLVQLVVVAVVGNQWSTQRIADTDVSRASFGGQSLLSLLTVSWRVTPRDGQTSRWAAQLIGLGALFVVAAVLTLVLVRGAVTFWRAFVAVTLATLAGVIADGVVVRAVADDFGQYDQIGGRPVAAVFSGGSGELPFGFALGLLAGLVAAIVAVASRRTYAPPVVAPAADGPEPYREPQAPPPWYGEQPAAGPHETAVLPTVGAGRPDPTDAGFGGVGAADRPVDRPADRPEHGPADGATTQLPRLDATPEAGAAPRPEQVAPASAESGDATQALPVEHHPVERRAGEDEPVEPHPVEPHPAEQHPGADGPAARPDHDVPPPAATGDGGATQAMPVVPEERPAEAPAAEPEGERTQAFPLPPDDEDHHHHDVGDDDLPRRG